MFCGFKRRKSISLCFVTVQRRFPENSISIVMVFAYNEFSRKIITCYNEVKSRIIIYYIIETRSLAKLSFDENVLLFLN